MAVIEHVPLSVYLADTAVSVAVNGARRYGTALFIGLATASVYDCSPVGPGA